MNEKTAAAPDLTPPSKGAKPAKAEGEKKAPRVSRFKTLYPESAKIELLVKENPKRGKSKDRFDGYFKSKTVGEAIKNGVTYADLAWDVGHGLIKVTV
jgi:hypothetical protein